MPPTPLREVFAKFSRIFFENVGAKIFSKSRSRRRDQFGPKIVQIRAILAIFEPFEVLGCQKSRIFGRPFTPRGWLRSASNFGKTRFRSSPTFHFLTLKKKIDNCFCQSFFLFPPPQESTKCLFWGSCEFLDVTGRCASKIHSQTYRLQPSMTLGGGVKEAVSVFFVSFGEKKLTPSSLRNSIL